MTNETIFMNRELSWLKFNERVLEEAESEKNPLCERLTFASIYQSNLDEFFMVRVGSLIDQMIVSKNVKDNKTGMTAKEQIQAILARVAKLNRRKDTVYENLMDEVAQAGIRLVDFRKIGKKEGKYLEQYFDEDLDYRDFMEGIIKKRKRLLPVRVEFSRELDGDIVDKICEYLDLDGKYVFRGSSPLDLSFVFQIQDSLRNHPELFYEKRVPQKSTQIDSKRSILEQIKEKDKLLSYPYESIRPFLDMLSEAANDDEVVSIKMTLYRVAKQSKVVEALIDAAENGKEVLVLVELKARFDEENNIEWSRRLEEAGCTVIYGLDGYKVHSKLCLITKKTNGKIEYYTQIGTGNYNEKTARLYTDLSLMTYDQEIGEEAAAIFQALFMGETVQVSKKLLVAPNCLQNRLLDMIEEEIRHAKRGEEAYIGVKMNSLTDKKLMDKLIEASQAGVEIELIVRGICCLIPGVEGYTENIRVISIVGRFLEHSRIYIFGKEERQKIYIASADWMTRNTVHRVEVVAPVEDPDLKLRLNEMFITMLSDNVQARELKSNGKYTRLQPGEEAPLNSQEFFYESAYEALESQEKNKIILQ